MIFGASSPDQNEHDLIDRVHSRNPFSRNRVTGEEAQLPDVASINSTAFRQLTELCNRSLEERRGIGAVVVGDAGMGKSHLLARLCRHLRERDDNFFSYIHNPQARADALPRYLVKSVLGQLTGVSQNLAETPLGTLLWECSQTGDDLVGAHPGEICSGFDRQAREILRRDSSGWHDQDIYHALGLLLASMTYPDGKVPVRKRPGFFARLFRMRPGTVSINTAAVLDWLSGWPISNQRELKGTGLQLDPKGPSSMESVMLAISELSKATNRPLVLIFDQVDNLDTERAESLAQFLHALLDHSENLVVIVAGVRERLYDLRDQGLISPAAWDRIAEEEFVLHPIVRKEADALIRERLDRFFVDFQDSPEYLREQKRDWTFPLGWDWLNSELGKQPDFRPRDVITWAKIRWRAQQERLDEMSPTAWLQRWRETGREPERIGDRADDLAPMVDAEIDRRLETAFHRRELDPNALLPDSDNMVGLIECLLALARQCESGSNLAEITEPKEGSACALRLRLETASGLDSEVGIAVLATQNQNRMADLLERLNAEPSPADRIVLVTDQRMPLTASDEVERALHRLRSRQDVTFQDYALTFTEHSMLDVLASVHSDALSGDVEVVFPNGRVQGVSSEEVIESYERRDRFLSQRLLRVLLGDAPATATEPEREESEEPAADAVELSEEEVERYRQHIVGHLALHEGAESNELAATYRQRYQPEADEAEVLAHIDSVIAGLDEENLVAAQPRNDHYYVKMIDGSG